VCPRVLLAWIGALNDTPVWATGLGSWPKPAPIARKLSHSAAAQVL
jgi:hypothetical protein